MKLSTSTGDFNGYVGSITEKIKSFQGSPFRYINLEQDPEGKDDPFFAEDDVAWQRRADEWGNAAAEAGVTFVVSHSPCVNVYGKLNEETYNVNMRALRRSVEVCHRLGIPRTVVHAGMNTAFSSMDFYEMNRRAYRDLLEQTEKYGVTIMTENMDSFTYHPLSTGKELRQLADMVDHPLFGVCWDTAHGNINVKAKKEGQYKCITDIGDKLKGMHIADNFGDGPHHHTWPFAGIINFDSVMQGLLDVGYDGFFNYEASYTLMHSVNVPFHREPWVHNGETVTTLHNPPIWLKKKAVELLYDVGKYILETYHCYEQ
jgi:sugar phosphate isomerase/epimerase